MCQRSAVAPCDPYRIRGEKVSIPSRKEELQIEIPLTEFMPITDMGFHFRFSFSLLFITDTAVSFFGAHSHCSYRMLSFHIDSCHTGISPRFFLNYVCNLQSGKGYKRQIWLKWEAPSLNRAYVSRHQSINGSIRALVLEP